MKGFPPMPRRTRLFAVPTAFLVAGSVALAATPSFADDAPDAAPASVTFGPSTELAAVVEGTLTTEIEAVVGRPLTFAFTNPDNAVDATVFAPGLYWIFTLTDMDGNPDTVEDVTFGIVEVILPTEGPLGLENLILPEPVGAVHVVELYDVPDDVSLLDLTEEQVAEVLLVAGQPKDSVSILAVAPPAADAELQFHFEGEGQPAAFSAVPARTAPGQVFVGDWDGDGVATPGFRIGNSFFLADSNAADATFTEVAYGREFDVIYVGDWDGDGVDTLGVRRGNTFHLSNSFDGGPADEVTAYGRIFDEVYIGDWDGDGVDTPSVRRGNTFHLKNSFTGGDADRMTAYGHPTDEVVVGDWDGDGITSPGVRRGNEFLLKNDFEGGAADETVAFGRADDKAIVGDWSGAGRDSVGVYRFR